MQTKNQNPENAATEQQNVPNAATAPQADPNTSSEGSPGQLADVTCSARSYGQSPFASLKELVDYFGAVCERSDAVVINAIKSYIVAGWTKYHGAFSIAQKQNQRISETLQFLRVLGLNRQPFAELRPKSL